MKVSELKAILKPLIKEAIKETLLEDGVLSTMITEVMKGVGGSQKIVEQNTPTSFQPQRENTNKQQSVAKQKMEEARKRQQKLLETIGKSTGGVNVFEGTHPLVDRGAVGDDSPATQARRSPLSSLPPDDPGVDLSIFGFGK